MPKDKKPKPNSINRFGPYEIHVRKKPQSDFDSNVHNEVVVDNTATNTGMTITSIEDFRNLILAEDILFHITEESETHTLQEQLEAEKAKCEDLEERLTCECPVCLEKLPISEAITLGECGHPHCKPCLRQLIVTSQLELLRTHQPHVPYAEWLITCSYCREHSSSYIINENSYSKVKLIGQDMECEFFDSAKEAYRAQGTAEGLLAANGGESAENLELTTYTQPQHQMFQFIQFISDEIEHSQHQQQLPQVMNDLANQLFATLTSDMFLESLNGLPAYMVDLINNLIDHLPAHNTVSLAELPDAEVGTPVEASSETNDGEVEIEYDNGEEDGDDTSLSTES